MDVCDSKYLGIDGLYVMCRNLQLTTKRSEKERIIEHNKECEDFKELLLFLFDNSVTTGLDIKKINKQTNSCDYYEFVNSFSQLLDYVKHNNTGRDYDINTVQHTACLFSDSEQVVDFIYEVVTKSLRLGIDAKTINKVFGYEFIPTFDVQLGTPIEDVKLNGDEEIFISQKLNGTRCIYWKGDLWTRSGKKYTGCQHIINDIKRLCVEDFTIDPNEVVFDGELVLKSCGLSDSEAFQKGTGIANSKNETKEELEYVIFDTMSSVEFEQKKCERKYGARRSSLENLPEVFNRLGLTNIRIVPFFYRGYNHEKIWEYLDYAEANDMEGVIVNLDTPYEFKRTKSLIKVKAYKDCSLECIRINIADKGKYKGILGSITCKYKEWTVDVGSGFNEEQRKYYTQHPNDIVGKIIEIKYKEPTKNKSGEESLQFPVFMGIRFDKDTPDF